MGKVGSKINGYCFIILLFIFLFLNYLDWKFTNDLILENQWAADSWYNLDYNPLAQFFAVKFGAKLGLFYLKITCLGLVFFPFLFILYSKSKKAAILTLFSVTILVSLVNIYQLYFLS